MKWIKVATAIGSDDKVVAVRKACKIHHAEAVGLVVGVLTAMPKLAPDGDLTDVSDAQIEGAAVWEGKRGVFAAAFRATWCTNGIVTKWEEWNGAARREFDRERQRSKDNYTRKKAGLYAVQNAVEHTEEASAKKVEGRSNYGNYPQGEEDTPCPPPPAFAEAVGWVAPRGHDALARLLTAVPEPTVWVGILRGYATGLSMDQNKSCDPERLAVAIEDFVGKGKHREANGASPKLFGAFVRSARAPIKRYAQQRTEAEERAEQLLIIRQNNAKKLRRGQPPVAEPAWAAEIDAQFPDGRTFPAGAAA